MKYFEIFLVFSILLLSWTIGNGLFPLLPVFASAHISDQFAVGMYMSFVYFGLLLGSYYAIRLVGASPLKWKIFGVGICFSLLLYIFPLMSNIYSLGLVNAMLWCALGVNLTLLNIHMSWQVDNNAGKIFGILGTAVSLGALIGGFSFGKIIDEFSIDFLFKSLSVVSLCMSFTALLLKNIPNPSTVSVIDAKHDTNTANQKIDAVPLYFKYFISIMLFITATMMLGRLITSIDMQNLGFSYQQISMTAFYGGLFTLPLPFLMGFISDKFGRIPILIICIICGALGLFLLTISNSLIYFNISAILISVYIYVSLSVSKAYANDIVGKEAIGKALSLINSSLAVDAIFGFSIGGLIVSFFGTHNTIYAITFLIPIATILLYKNHTYALSVIRRKK